MTYSALYKSDAQQRVAALPRSLKWTLYRLLLHGSFIPACQLPVLPAGASVLLACLWLFSRVATVFEFCFTPTSVLYLSQTNTLS